MSAKMGVAMVAGAVAMAATAVHASGIPLNLDPGTPFTLYTLNTNDGYSGGRGMVFIADEAITVNGAALWTASTGGLNATFELYETITTVGNVLAGATLLRSFNTTLLGSLDFHGGKFDAITLQTNQSYLLRVFYSEAADENWFYDFDPVFFGDPPVDIGAVTLIDGTASGDTANFVAPYLQIQLLPGPFTLALLGLAGAMGSRRRRR